MVSGKTFDLTGKKRIFHYPYPIAEIGWLPHHLHIHHHDVVKGCFVCMSCNYESRFVHEINGKLLTRDPSRFPAFSILSNGTELYTVEGAYHDELFFRYEEEAAENLMKFFGEDLCRNGYFFFPGFPRAILSELRQELTRVNVLGTVDRIDQIGIRLFTEIIAMKESRKAEKNTHEIKLHTIAVALSKGLPLESLLYENGYSERTFYREWKKIFTLSPKEYVLRMQVERACSLLSGSEKSPADIALECGFRDTVHFYKIFQKKMHTTPRCFRTEHAAELFPAEGLPMF